MKKLMVVMLTVMMLFVVGCEDEVAVVSHGIEITGEAGENTVALESKEDRSLESLLTINDLNILLADFYFDPSKKGLITEYFGGESTGITQEYLFFTFEAKPTEEEYAKLVANVDVVTAFDYYYFQQNINTMNSIIKTDIENEWDGNGTLMEWLETNEPVITKIVDEQDLKESISLLSDMQDVKNAVLDKAYLAFVSGQDIEWIFNTYDSNFTHETAFYSFEAQGVEGFENKVNWELAWQGYIDMLHFYALNGDKILELEQGTIENEFERKFFEQVKEDVLKIYGKGHKFYAKG